MSESHQLKSELFLTFDVEPFWVTIPTSSGRERWDDDDGLTSYWTTKFLNFCIDNAFGATFFVVGRWAEYNREIVKRIADSGFEVGSHSYWHEDMAMLEKNSFIDDASRSKKLLEDITGKPVNSFRAPSFSIKNEQLSLLHEIGYSIDSSTTDAMRIHGGQASTTNCGSLELLPFHGCKFAGRSIPVLGGGYMRALPEFFFKTFKQSFLGNMIYLHPVDLPQSVLPQSGLSRGQNFRKRLRFGSSFEKLLILNSQYEFVGL